MRDDEIDRMFSDEAGIEPSPGFAARVMDAVRHEASAPPPIPFPGSARFHAWPLGCWSWCWW